MFTARAFWMQRRNAGFEFGSGPPFFVAMVISLPMRANCLAMRFQRANMACLRTSKMRPIVSGPVERRAQCTRARDRGQIRGPRLYAGVE